MPKKTPTKAVKPNKTATKAKKGPSYGAEQITVLEGLEPVRKRPGMYIGTTGPDGLHHLIWEVFDNSRDEAMGGFADTIEVALLPGNKIRIVDNGRGIPVDIHKQTKVSALETIMTTLHAGGKFGGDESGYKVSGGLHGVGVSVVNALSVYTKVEVHKDGGHYIQEYSRGKPKAKVKKIGSTNFEGTVVVFEADQEIFKEIVFDWNKIVAHLRQQAYLVKGTRIGIYDAREYAGKTDLEDGVYIRDMEVAIPSQTFYFEQGLRSLVAFNNRFQKPIHKNIFYVEKEEDGVTVEVALQYADDISPRLIGFANNIYNSEGGTHITGFKTALTRTINTYARKNNVVKESDENFTGDDVLEGITAVVSVKMPEVQFEGQTKGKLGSVEARGAVETVFGEAFSDFLETHPDEAKSIASKTLLALKARKAAKAAKDSVLRKGALDGMTLPGKLADCQSKSAEESELFIVEGDSAGGCFDGNTKVALTDGRNLTFKELVVEDKDGKQNYCYTIDDGDVGVAPILNPRITKHNAEVLKVTLDSGEEIICTPDHRFMLRDQSYQQAQQLTSEDSLMPLRRQLSRLGRRITIKGYELVYTPGAHQWIFTHLLGDRFNMKHNIYTKTDNTAVHHKDFNKLNNNPDNLVRLDKQEHILLHTQSLHRTLHSEASKEAARRTHKTREYREKIRTIMSTSRMRTLLSLRAKKQWENLEYKEFMKQKFSEFYNTHPEYRTENNANLNAAQKLHWSKAENRKAQSKRVTEFFVQNPEVRSALCAEARTQWDNADLRAWRAETTKKQWTSEFRANRKVAYNKTYLTKALKAFNDIWKKTKNIDVAAYNRIRKETNDRSLIRHDTILKRFFNNDTKRFEEAVVNFNHRIKHIEKVHERMDVYDLQVAGTHNFALASGIFVHNSSKQGRDRRTQAILPLRGKILNVERARLDRMLASNEIKALVVALGTAIGDLFNLEKLRYHKVIIATDADVDGAHIRTLLLTLFYRYFKEMIEGGFVYIAQPPLYKIKKGKDVTYAYTDDEKADLIGTDIEITEENDDTVLDEDEDENDREEDVQSKKSKPKTKKVTIQRYKGLGEMNPDELWETTMDPARRILKQVTIEDAQDADRVFDILMGTDVPARKSFIQSNAKTAKLDI